MNSKGLYMALAWLLTVGVAYAIGWWTGVKSAAHIAVGAADSGISFALIILAVVAIITTVTAFRLRGYWDRRHTTPTVQS